MQRRSESKKKGIAVLFVAYEATLLADWYLTILQTVKELAWNVFLAFEATLLAGGFKLYILWLR